MSTWSYILQVKKIVPYLCHEEPGFQSITIMVGRTISCIMSRYPPRSWHGIARSGVVPIGLRLFINWTLDDKLKHFMHRH